MNINRKMFFDDLFDIFSMIIGSNYVTLYDIKEQVTRYSPAIVEMIGLPGEYISDGVYNWMDYIHPEDRHKYEMVMGEMLALRKHTYDLSYRVRLKNGEYNMFRFVGGLIRDVDGHPSVAGGMMIHSGLIERTDRVTSMKNLNAFLADLRDWSQKAPVREDTHLFLLLLGFGRLAHINEVYGYGYGSRVLKKVGEIIDEMVAGVAEVYRMEGSKFALVSTKLSQPELTALYKEIQKRLKSGVEVDGMIHNLLIYGGMLSVDEKQDREERTLYDCLRHAYAESKQYRHGELAVYNGNHVAEPSVADSIAMIGAIRESLVADFEGFYLVYQPVFGRKTERPIGAEVMLRWKNERYGEVPADAFLAEIEQDYTFGKLGYWVIRNAMIDGMEFLESNPRFQVFVTVRASQVEDPYFANNIEELARETGFPSSRLSIELTNKCRVLDMEKLCFFAESLQEKGVRIGLDDFARGNAWLKAFTQIEPDHVRFSEELVKNLDRSKRVQTILSHLVRMVHDCDVDVFIKGIESQGEKEILGDLPICGMQGMLLSGPIYYDEVLEYDDTEDADHK